jgi:hypothetical protein
MAGDRVAIRRFQRRRLLRTQRPRVGATGVEMATGGRIERTRNVPGEHRPFAPQAGIGQRNRGQQCLRVWMARRREQRPAISELDDPAQVHHGDPVGDVLDHGEVVRNEHVGQPELALQVLQQVDHLGLHRHVERRHGFVTDDQHGLGGERAGDADPLALAA